MNFQVTRTPQGAKKWLKDQGKTVRKFCQEHGLNEQAAYEVLNGRQPGNFGEAHRAAVALGIKPNPGNPAPAITEEEYTVLQKVASKGVIPLQPTGA